MEENIVKMIEKRALSNPKRELLRFKEEKGSNYRSICWGDFWRDVNKAARSILSLGYGKDCNIGIMSDNKPEWTISDVAILATRGVVVPIFGGSSKDQIKFIIEQTQMKLLFVGNKTQLENAIWALRNTSTLEKIVFFSRASASSDSRCISWDEFLLLDISDQHSDKLKESINSIDSKDIATILFTSGTTGNPKGIMLSHSNFTQCFNIHDKRLFISSNDVSLCFLPLSHVFERAWTFYMLYKNVINVYLENPKEVINEIKAIKPTVMCTVPRFFEKTYDGIQNEVEKWSPFKKKVFNWALSTGYLVSYYHSKNKRLPALVKLKQTVADRLVLKKLRGIFGGKIRTLPCAGAAISNKQLRFFHAAGIFVNYGYGATETTATVSCFKHDEYDLSTCGSVMPEVEVKISDTGEIWVKGETVFQGYYKNPEASSQVLVDGWYKTGDMGYLTEKGDLVMTERINDIFKTSGGKFICPQKIENLLLEDSLIDQIVVLGDNQKFISALIVPSYDKLKAIRAVEDTINVTNENIASNPRVYELIKQRIEDCTKELPSYERVVNFRILSEPFTIQNNGLTNTLKVRRKLVAEKYKDLINEMYK